MPLSPEAIHRLRTETFGEDTFAGRFELRGEAASGGMSRVFEGVDRATGDRVAIKLLLGGEDRVRFAAEAAMLERLQHSGLVRYIRHGENRDGVPYLAMEWLAGETLATRLARGPLSVLEASELGAQLADALAYLHGEGVIHRDLKPSNIFVTDGRVRLIDLGIAKDGAADLTRTGQIVGTPGYMAPEQARGDKSADARIDLFALGCVLYEALSGRPPFEGTAVMEVLARLLLHTPPPIEMVAVGVPPRLAVLIEALLAKAPADRLADATDARSELAAIARAIRAGDRDALGARSVVSSANRPTLDARPRARRRRWPLVAVASLAGLVAVGWAATAERRPDLGALARDCERGDLGACTRGAALVDTMRDAKQLAAGEATVMQVGFYEQGCKRGEVALCFELGRRLTPMLGTYPADPARAYALVIGACTAKHRDACTFLETMLARRLGDATAQRAGRIAYVDACAAKLLACTLGTVEVSSPWASDVIVDGDDATRTAVPGVLALPAGPHRLAYVHGARRCHVDVEVTADRRTVAEDKACDTSVRPPRTAPGGDEGSDRAVRAQVAALASLQGKYISPCWPEDKVRFWGRGLEPGGEGDALRELQRYRNLMACKHVRKGLIPGSNIEDQFHAALARGDAATAKQVAGTLIGFVRALVVDVALVRRRLASTETMFAKHDVVANAPALAAMLADARAELAAGRFEASNVVLDELDVEINSLIVERP